MIRKELANSAVSHKISACRMTDMHVQLLYIWSLWNMTRFYRVRLPVIESDLSGCMPSSSLRAVATYTFDGVPGCVHAGGHALSATHTHRSETVLGDDRPNRQARKLSVQSQRASEPTDRRTYEPAGNHSQDMHSFPFLVLWFL